MARQTAALPLMLLLLLLGLSLGAAVDTAQHRHAHLGPGNSEPARVGVHPGAGQAQQPPSAQQQQEDGSSLDSSSTTTTTVSMPLEQLMREMTAADVAALLARVGYADAVLGQPTGGHAPPAVGRRFVERTTARVCDTVTMHGASAMSDREAAAAARAARGQPGRGASPANRAADAAEAADADDFNAAAEAAAADAATSGGRMRGGPNSNGAAPSPASAAETGAAFVETASAASTGTTGPGGASRKKTTRKELDCECETYKCSCRKDCYCSLNDEHFEGTQVVRNSSKNALPVSNADHQFKCSCAFEGVGGVGLISGGTMNCDCKMADCSCEKQCVCRSKAAARLGAGFLPRFQETRHAPGAAGADAVWDEGAEESDASAVAAAEAAVVREDAGDMDIIPG